MRWRSSAARACWDRMTCLLLQVIDVTDGQAAWLLPADISSRVLMSSRRAAGGMLFMSVLRGLLCLRGPGLATGFPGEFAVFAEQEGDGGQPRAGLREQAASGCRRSSSENCHCCQSRKSRTPVSDSDRVPGDIRHFLRFHLQRAVPALEGGRKRARCCSTGCRDSSVPVVMLRL
ncbi:Uncharacterised protein [Escherichia coli]|nr:Uncharacterised protein [Escherichia coli]